MFEYSARMRRIAVEEHFLIPELAAAGERFLASPAAAGSGWREAGAVLREEQRRATGGLAMDLGAGRIAAMDAAGIDMQVLLVSVVGQLQSLPAAEASALARLANDRVADAVAVHPDRLAALATVAPQDPVGAARELERAIGELGFKGLTINSHIGGEYLDAPRFVPLLEAAEALDAPIYLHPSLLPADAIRPYLDYGLMAAIWGYAADASLHALRIILSGVFDRHPGLTLVLGHLGEHIPFSLPRIDIHHLQTKANAAPHLQRLPSEYFAEHVLVTTSGMNHAPDSIRFCVHALGAERVMFAADYPFEPLAPEVEGIHAVPLDDAERELICHGNAERVFSLR
jgi:2,3-dihydroxybenzoate decarboxylase